MTATQKEIEELLKEIIQKPEEWEVSTDSAKYKTYFHQSGITLKPSYTTAYWYVDFNGHCDDLPITGKFLRYIEEVLFKPLADAAEKSYQDLMAKRDEDMLAQIKKLLGK